MAVRLWKEITVNFPLRAFGVASLFLSICIPILAQVASTENARFQIEGTVFGPTRAVVPWTEITFRSDSGTVTVHSDENGSYRIELPLGAYTMSTRVPSGFREYARPLFRVDAATNLVMDIPLVFARNNCDIVVVRKDSQPATQEEWQEAGKEWCGGKDLYSLPSKDGTHYQVLIQYPKRSRYASGYDYTCDKWPTAGVCMQVSVAYNLFALEADHVAYDVEHHRIKATGHVVVTRSGNKTTSESLSLTLADGGARLTP